MSRTSTDQYANGRLINGFDYDHQAWVADGKYVRCGHPETMNCGCYGRVHEGEDTLRPEVAAEVARVSAVQRANKERRRTERELESNRGDFAQPCPECGAPEDSGHYGICSNG